MSEPKTNDARLARLETGLQTLTENLGSFVEDSHRYRQEERESSKEQTRKHDEEISKIWTEMAAQNKHLTDALSQQGKNFTDSINLLSHKGEITWPKIVTTITIMLGLVTTAAVAGHNFVTLALEKRDSEISRIDRDRERERIEEAEHYVRVRTRLDSLDARALQYAYQAGQAETRFLWLRDDAEAIKDDLLHHLQETR